MDQKNPLCQTVHQKSIYQLWIHKKSIMSNSTAREYNYGSTKSIMSNMSNSTPGKVSLYLWIHKIHYVKQYTRIGIFETSDPQKSIMSNSTPGEVSL